MVDMGMAEDEYINLSRIETEATVGIVAHFAQGLALEHATIEQYAKNTAFSSDFNYVFAAGNRTCGAEAGEKDGHGGKVRCNEGDPRKLAPTSLFSWNGRSSPLFRKLTIWRHSSCA